MTMEPASTRMSPTENVGGVLEHYTNKLKGMNTKRQILKGKTRKTIKRPDPNELGWNGLLLPLVVDKVVHGLTNEALEAEYNGLLDDMSLVVA